MKFLSLVMVLMSCAIARAAAPAVPAAPTVPEQVRWIGPATIVAPPAVPVTVRIHCPDRATKAVWNGMPQGVQATVWQREGDDFVSKLTPPAIAMPGSVRLSATVQGATWQREFEPLLTTIPAIHISADAYAPGERLMIQVVSKLPQPAEALVQTRKAAGALLPGVLTLEPGTETKIAFLPAEGARGVVPLTLKLANDVEQMHWLRPLSIDVPRAGQIQLDGDLKDWPSASRLDSRYFASSTVDLPVEAYLAHTDAGVYVAARLATRNLRPTDPKTPSTGTHIELCLDTSDEKANAKTKSTHQFFFHPVKQADTWQLAAGEWKRHDAGPATLHDEPRCQTAIRVDTDSTTFEAFIPTDTLGVQPAGAWRALLSLRIQDEPQSPEGAWPRPRAEVIDVPARWGVLRFAP